MLETIGIFMMVVPMVIIVMAAGVWALWASIALADDEERRWMIPVSVGILCFVAGLVLVVLGHLAANGWQFPIE